jgi:prephenate dehydrogenase
MEEKMKKSVLIVGLGLIGSSLALCIKKQQPQLTIYGLDHHKEYEKVAKQRGIIDVIAPSFEQSATEADYILLCSPVSETLKQLKRISKLTLKSTVIVSDVGSTKCEVVALAQALGIPGFVGGHPMAGSHKSGVNAADERLFENAYYIFTETKNATKSQIAQLQRLLTGTHAKFITMSASEHDQITGMLSHLPHIIAAGLVNQSQAFNEKFPRASQLAAGGFRDITRIASSDPKMWTDILLSNKDILLHLLGQWQAEMNQVKSWLQTENNDAIHLFFTRAKETRSNLAIHKEGAIPAFYDLFVDIPDEPGVIAEITYLLGAAAISLTNLKILETREEITGILQLTFKKPTDLAAAKKEIETKTSYLCYENQR